MTITIEDLRNKYHTTQHSHVSYEQWLEAQHAAALNKLTDAAETYFEQAEYINVIRVETERLRDFAIGQIRAYLDDTEPERDGLARGAYNNQRHTAKAAYCALVGDPLAKSTREDLESVVPRTTFTIRKESEAQDG